LEADYELILLDARYHGRSEAPDADCTPLVMAADLAGAIRALGLNAPLVLGHSMGAQSAIVMAGQYPEAAGAILLEDPPATWVPDLGRPDEQTWLANNRAWIAGLQAKTRETIMAEKHAETPVWAIEELGPWADSKLRFNTGYFAHVRRPAIDWSAIMSAIRVPVLLITGDPALGSIVTTEDVAALQANLPQAHVAHIGGAGHNIRRDQFPAYLEAVRPALAAWAQKS
jgi:pimeloyl-ACP methyl ester carboxylesterase